MSGFRGGAVGSPRHRTHGTKCQVTVRSPTTAARSDLGACSKTTSVAARCPTYRRAATPLSLKGDRLKCAAARRPEAGVAGASRRFPQKLDAAGLRMMTDVTGECRAPDAGREHDGAVVERGELRTMADADDGCIFELAHQALHQSVLAR